MAMAATEATSTEAVETTPERPRRSGRSLPGRERLRGDEEVETAVAEAVAVSEARVRELQRENARLRAHVTALTGALRTCAAVVKRYADRS
jgi:hypothetical protein